MPIGPRARKDFQVVRSVAVAGEDDGVERDAPRGSNEPSIAQALHLTNSEEITGKVRDRRGTARRLARSDKAPREIIDELYLGTVSRYPTDKERTLMLRVFVEAGEDRQAAVEDVLWALLNKREFVYNH